MPSNLAEVDNLNRIGRLTVADYATCVDNHGCTPAEETGSSEGLTASDRKKWNDAKLCNANQDGRGKYPINCVTWHQAAAYCKATDDSRLPTEAQWEFAARGPDREKRTKGEPYGRTYPWGGQDPSATLLNACDPQCRALSKRLRISYWDVNKPMFDDNDGFEATAPVGHYPDGASPFGALDMAGNVWEWVADEYVDHYEATNPAAPPLDPDPVKTTRAEKDKVYSLRGGGWFYDEPSNVRAAYRLWNAPSVRSIGIGFRCARGVR